MKILVCIKQVPGSNNVAVDPITGVLKRDGVKSKLNPYDLYALEEGISLAERFGASLEVITMGPPQAKEIIIEAICMGATGGNVISDRKFAGSDVLATAYTLSQGIKKCGDVDLIICGKQTTDGDTAQVGAEIAEFLGIPNVSNVLAIEDISEGKAYLKAALDDEIISMCVCMPCLISVESDINSPRLPSYKKRRTVTEDMVGFISFDDLEDRNPDNYGLSGSATQVEKIFAPEKNAEKHTIEGNAFEVTESLFDIICEHKLI